MMTKVETISTELQGLLIDPKPILDGWKLLAETNDLVVIDSPPVLAVSDPKVLSRLADKSIYVVRWAETRREIVTTGLNQIIDIGSDVAGVVLSMVDVRRHAQYGYGDSGYYYGQSRKYYTS